MVNGVSSNFLDVTVLIATKNEEANIAKCILSCEPAYEIYVIDSGSSDRTTEIASDLGARVLTFAWNGRYPKKRQWALDNIDFKTKWILLLDADEEVDQSLWCEIEANIIDSKNNVAFFIKKEFHFLGKKFRFGGFSHWACLLITCNNCRFENLNESASSGLDMEVHERVITEGGKTTYLSNYLKHEDFKGLQAYISKHNAYSTWEAELRAHMFEEGVYGVDTIQASAFGNVQQRKRFVKFLVIRLPFESLLWFGYHYLFRLGFLHGRAGWIASRMRANYIADVRAKTYEIALMKGRDE